jgi:hypothetical protein
MPRDVLAVVLEVIRRLPVAVEEEIGQSGEV